MLRAARALAVMGIQAGSERDRRAAKLQGAAGHRRLFSYTGKLPGFGRIFNRKVEKVEKVEEKREEEKTTDRTDGFVTF
jgi:hypothetical protein